MVLLMDYILLKIGKYQPCNVPNLLLLLLVVVVLVLLPYLHYEFYDAQVPGRHGRRPSLRPTETDVLCYVHL